MRGERGKPIVGSRVLARFAHPATPRTTGTPEDTQPARPETYRAAIHHAMRDGAVSAKERAPLLFRLAENLSLTGDEALSIERELVGPTA